MSSKLFVGNLSFNTTENDLQGAFAAHGTVVETNLMMDRVSGRPRGDRKSTRLNSSHLKLSRMPSSA